MRVGILGVDSNRGRWGGYQYSLSVTHALLSSNRHEYCIFHSDTRGSPYETIKSKSILIPQKENLLITLCRRLAIILNLRFPLGKYRIIDELDCHLLVIPQTAGLAGCYLKTPFITCIHDIMHKYYPHFPEYPGYVKIKRDMTYAKAAKNAVFTIVDSEQGKEDMVNFYNISSERVKVIPFIPPPYVFLNKAMTSKVAEELIARFNLPDSYLFYPAQFWFHKNHERLFESLLLLRKQYQEEIPVVLVGSEKSNLAQMMSVVDKLRMKSQVYYLGYVSDQEIVALYRKARALIFPSLFGPTNIPILEALVLGTPVACSNLFAMPDQVGGAGVLFDPFNIGDMAEKIYLIWKDRKLRKRLVEKGYEKINDLTYENYANKWNQVIDEALDIIKTGPKTYFQK